MRSPTATVPAIFCHIEWRLMQIICQGATKSKLLNEVDSKARLCRRTPLNTHFACWEAHKRDSGPPPDPSQHAICVLGGSETLFEAASGPLSARNLHVERPPQMMSLFQGASQHAISVLRGVLSFFFRDKFNIKYQIIWFWQPIWSKRVPRAFPRTLQDSDFCQHWCPNADKWKWTSVFDTGSFLRHCMNAPLGRNLHYVKRSKDSAKKKHLILWRYFTEIIFYL